MRNAGLEEAQAGIKIAVRNLNNLRYSDDTTRMEESEEELKSFFFYFTLSFIYFTLQYCLVLPYIDMNLPWVYMCSPSWNPLPPSSPSIPLGHPSAPARSMLHHALNPDWWFISHMIIYMFQCYSFRSFHPRFLPQSPKVCSLQLCLLCCLSYRVIVTIFLNSIYMH